ncbi:MAG: hypothetical protein ACKVQB_04845, partial [Bacteroidia bacterium]
MKLTKGLWLIGCLAIVFAACKDENDDTPVITKTKMEMLTTGSWISTDVLYSGFSVWDSVSACEKDNFYTLKADSTGTLDEGTTKCDTADLQLTQILWKLSSDEKRITLDDQTGELILLSETAMNIKMTVPIF